MTLVPTSATWKRDGSLGLKSIPFLKDHLPHSPIAVIEMVCTNIHHVPWADMVKWILRFNRYIAVIGQHTLPASQYTCTYTHEGVGVATDVHSCRLGAGVLRETDVGS